MIHIFMDNNYVDGVVESDANLRTVFEEFTKWVMSATPRPEGPWNSDEEFHKDVDAWQLRRNEFLEKHYGTTDLKRSFITYILRNGIAKAREFQLH